MADVFGPENKSLQGSEAKQRHLRDLATFLEEEENAMKIDTASNHKKNKPSPD